MYIHILKLVHGGNYLPKQSIQLGNRKAVLISKVGGEGIWFRKTTQS